MLYCQSGRGPAGMSSTSDKRHHAPRLVPTGNVDDVLLNGKSHGKNLSLFQSLGLTIIGACFFVTGILVIIAELFFRTALFRSFINLSTILFGVGIGQIGGGWIVLGLRGMANRRRPKTSAQTHSAYVKA